MPKKPTADKPRRDPKDRPLKSDKRVSLAPLDFERALGGILRAGPHKEKAPRKGRRKPSGD